MKSSVANDAADRCGAPQSPLAAGVVEPSAVPFAPTSGSPLEAAGQSPTIAELRVKAELLQSIVDSLADGLVAVDRNGRFTQFNPAGERILGRDGARGNGADWSQVYGLFQPDGTPFPHDQLPLYRAMQGVRSRDVEMIVRNDDIGEEKWLKVTASPVNDEHGEVSGGVVLFRDETETKRMQRQLAAERDYLRHLIRVQDRDRTLTAYELHDGVVQLMTGALLRLEASTARDETASEVKHDHEHAHAAMQLLREAIDDARRLIGGLSPPVIEELGVVGAIDYLIADHERADGLNIAFTHRLEADRYPAIVESTIFRIVQEALNNIARHAATKRAAVTLEEREGNLHLSIRDWGCGFEIGNRRARRYGLRGIEERTRLLGGTFGLESGPGRGTVIELVLPTNPTSYDTNEI